MKIRSGTMRSVASLRLIGYWRNDEDPSWPDASDFVDHAWPTATRQLVIAYLARGPTLQQYRGLSPCRFCDQHNGSKELTDGTYCWPEGLAHYVATHDVRLPNEFVTHVESSTEDLEARQFPEFDHLGQRLRGGGYDDEYDAWIATTAELFRTGQSQDTTTPNWLNSDIAQRWWSEQDGWTPRQGE